MVAQPNARQKQQLLVAQVKEPGSPQEKGAVPGMQQT
jgi:hypothetical protein